MVGLSCHVIVTTLLEMVLKGEKRPQDEILKMAEVLGI